LALVELPELMATPELAGEIPEHEPPPIGSLLQAAYGNACLRCPNPPGTHCRSRAPILRSPDGRRLTHGTGLGCR
jgi:hypothetical protein